MNALTSLPEPELSARFPTSLAERRTPLRPVKIALRNGLHLLVIGLTLFTIVRAVAQDADSLALIAALGAIFIGWYVAGVVATHYRFPEWARVVWLAALLLIWIALAALTPDAAFIAFPLFFLQLHVLPTLVAVPLVAITFLFSVWSTSAFLGFDVGSVLGPLISAGVAIVIGLGYRAMDRETAERQALILDLVATREELASASREAGALAERERLAREIHDTVAQGLSSIQMLLRAAERDISNESTRERLRLARETAADNLGEARRFIRELTPPLLDDQTLPAALRRLAEATNQQAAQSGSRTRITFHTSGDARPLPMALEATLLRIAQGSLANVLAHASAARAELTLSYFPDEIAFDLVDDGVGFDPAAPLASSGGFGLHAIRRRVGQLSGVVDVESSVGDGTAISVRMPILANTGMTS